MSTSFAATGVARTNLPFGNLGDIEARLRNVFKTRLSQTINQTLAHSPILNQVLDHLEEKGAAHFYVDFQSVLPVEKSYLSQKFHEALFRFDDGTGNIISPKTMLDALEIDKDLAQSFRLWRIAADIKEFESSHEAPFDRISININPQDLEDGEFLNYLHYTLLAAKEQNHNIILEALEISTWTEEHLNALKKLTTVGLAIDDYGCEDGHHTPKTLQLMQNVNPLIVKIAGALKNNPQRLAQVLRDIETIVPQATIVMEWIGSRQELTTLQSRLPDNLGVKINMIQDRAFSPRTSVDFLLDPT